MGKYKGVIFVVLCVCVFIGAGCQGVLAVRPERFGAWANDDRDDSEAIRKAIEHANESAGRIVNFRAGTYIVSQPLVFKAENGFDNISMIGYPGYWGQTTIVFKNIPDGESGFSLLGHSKPRRDSITHWLVKNIKFVGTGSQPETLFYGKLLTYAKFENCAFIRAKGNGFQLDKGWCISFENCYANLCGGSGFYLYGWSIQMVSCNSRDNDIGVFLRSVQAFTMKGGNLETNKRHAIRTQFGYSRAVKIDGVYLEAVKGKYPIFLQSCGYAEISPAYRHSTPGALYLGGNVDFVNVTCWWGNVEIDGGVGTTWNRLQMVNGDVVLKNKVNHNKIDMCSGDVTLGKGVEHNVIDMCGGEITDKSGNETNKYAKSPDNE